CRCRHRWPFQTRSGPHPACRQRLSHLWSPSPRSSPRPAPDLPHHPVKFQSPTPPEFQVSVSTDPTAEQTQPYPTLALTC
ncbi:unnamed protein product, partial [Gulo gulo]